MLEVQTDINIPIPQDGDWLKVVDGIRQIMLDGVHRQFIEGGYPEKWTPKKDGSASYLFAGGALVQGIDSEFGQQGDEFYARVMTTGGLPYAAIHNWGGYAGRNHSAYIPARPYMVIAEEDQEKIGDSVVGMIVEVHESEPTKSVNRREEF